eukprot:scaffold645_cov247-Pinguiococcus_pyrenoidosus.AAC.21
MKRHLIPIDEHRGHWQVPCMSLAGRHRHILLGFSEPVQHFLCLVEALLVLHQAQQLARPLARQRNVRLHHLHHRLLHAIRVRQVMKLPQRRHIRAMAAAEREIQKTAKQLLRLVGRERLSCLQHCPHRVLIRRHARLSHVAEHAERLPKA